MKEQLLKFGSVSENVSLKKYNTFKIGGICKYMVHPRDNDMVFHLMHFLKQANVTYFVLGNGSNIIFSDEFYDGVIVKLDFLQKISFQDDRVVVGSGVMIPKLAQETMKLNLTGMEWAIGIPATVGGCVFGNAEAYKVSTFDYLVDVLTITPEGDYKRFLKSELSHDYRTSFFKQNPGYIILEATFQLAYGVASEMRLKVLHRKEKRISTQPLEFPSAGSVFRNPAIGSPSGKLIEDAGLKNKFVGGAKVSDKHANFIVNTGNATSQDVKNLIELVHQNVFLQYGIDLIMEQEYVGWNCDEKRKKENKEKTKTS